MNSVGATILTYLFLKNDEYPDTSTVIACPCVPLSSEKRCLPSNELGFVPTSAFG